MSKPRLTCRRAFELGALAMRQLAIAKCGNLTEGLQEDAMTNGSLTAAEKVAMNHQVVAIEEVQKDIGSETVGKAAYYGSYILADRERDQIRELFPDIGVTRGRDLAMRAVNLSRAQWARLFDLHLGGLIITMHASTMAVLARHLFVTRKDNHDRWDLTDAGRRALKYAPQEFNPEPAVAAPESRFTEEACPGHVASENDPKICGRCGIHIDSLLPPDEGAAPLAEPRVPE